MGEGDSDTEQKIKDAAREIFHKKGFTNTKTRDIAEAADINLALLNYYFRSKKKLFDIIMLETMKTFFSGLSQVLNDESSSLIEKISAFSNHYIEFLLDNPNMPTFILNTIREHPDEYINDLGIVDIVKGSEFFNQFQGGIKNGEIPPINPIHLMLNLMGMVVFPFIVEPMIKTVTGISEENFKATIVERKRLIPLWVNSMLTVK